MIRPLMAVSILLVVAGSVEARQAAAGASRTRNARAALAQRAAIYQPHILRAASRYGIDARVLWTIAYLESGFNPRAVSPKGARGLMQFMPSTARRYGLKNPHEPVHSIDAAARYVRDLSRLFGGRTDLVLAGYNAGESAVVRAGYRVPGYRETRQYVARGKPLMRRIDLPLRQTRIAENVETQSLIEINLSRQSIYMTHAQASRLQSPSPRLDYTVTRSSYFSGR